MYYKQPLLLRWKGLDLLVEAIGYFEQQHEPIPDVSLCYITPKDSALPVSNLPTVNKTIHLYEDPKAFNAIRAAHSIFVSES